MKFAVAAVETVTVVVPAATPVTVPSAATVAMAVLAEVKDTVPSESVVTLIFLVAPSSTEMVSGTVKVGLTGPEADSASLKFFTSQVPALLAVLTYLKPTWTFLPT